MYFIFDRNMKAMLLICLIACAAVADTDSDELLGRFWLPDRDGQVEMYKVGERYFGRVIAYEISDQLDENNPDPKLRSRRFVGIDMFSGFHYNERKNRWEGGTIYDAEGGKTYKCRLWFENDDSGVLWARGFIGLSVFGRTERFERVIDRDTTSARHSPSKPKVP